MDKPWKVILVLLGIFAAGGVTGGFVTVRVWRERLANRPVPEEWAPRHLKRLADRLDLTPQQQEQIRPIIKRNMEQLNRLRNRSMAEAKTAVEGMQREITEQLTPEQRAKFEQMNRELREQRDAREAKERAERTRRSSGERPGEGPRPGPDRPPPEKPPEKPPEN
jgi:uncharacterized membrane protein